MRYPFYDNPDYKKKQAEITHKYWQLGRFDFRIKSESRSCQNLQCSSSFIVKPHDKKKYCGSSCAAMVNNAKRPKKFYYCIACNKQIYRAGRKYCSVKCQCDSYYKQYISRWKQGLEDGNRGINTRSLSGHIRRYLLEKFKDNCARCGWNRRHPKTLVVPLEINHIDGNSENNREENLELICPNCHALTPNFRNLNKGRGREWRLDYIKTRKIN